METSVHGITAPSAVYEIGGRLFEVGSRGFTEAIADAHEDGAAAYIAAEAKGIML